MPSEWRSTAEFISWGQPVIDILEPHVEKKDRLRLSSVKLHFMSRSWTWMPWVLLAMLGLGPSSLDGPTRWDYLGQTPPGDDPVVFAMGTVSVEGRNTHAVRFSPDGGLLVFSRYPDGTSYYMVRSGAEWSDPKPTSFRGKEVSFDALSKRLFYYDPQGDLCFVRYSSDGFSKPTRLPPAINTAEIEYYPCVTEQGNLFFSRNSRWDQARIQVSKLEGTGFGRPVDLGPPVNVGGASHEFVAPDESYMLFNSPRPGSHTQNDIWVSFRRSDGGWGEPINLGPRINRDAKAILCPTVSPNGKYLFFTRFQEDNTGLVYWVRSRVIEELRLESNG